MGRGWSAFLRSNLTSSNEWLVAAYRMVSWFGDTIARLASNFNSEVSSCSAARLPGNRAKTIKDD